MINSHSVGQAPTHLGPMRRLFENLSELAANVSAIAALSLSAAPTAAAQVRDAAAASAPVAAEQAASAASLVEGFAYMGVTASLVALALMLLSPRLWDREPPR